MKQNKLRVIIILIIAVFLIGILGISIRMAFAPAAHQMNEKRTEASSVLNQD